MKTKQEMAAACAWCLLGLALGLCFAAVAGAQNSAAGANFISIDCGIADDYSYVDATTNITFISDAQFIDTGTKKNISAAYATPSLAKAYLNVRSFPDGSRNCYRITSVTAGLKYLIRASFLYGNYDGLSKNPSFDLYLGVNLWQTITITDPAIVSLTEVTTAVVTDSISVCLVDTGNGIPFISALLLRPMNNVIYPAVNASTSLVLIKRFNMGPSHEFVRYPYDPYDRIWEPFSNAPLWTEILNNSTVMVNALFDVPSSLMQTAVVPVNSTKLFINFIPPPGFTNEYYINTHFAQLQSLPENESRQFNIYINDSLCYAQPFTPQYLFSTAVYSNRALVGFRNFNLSIEGLSNSTLPPILNAMEVFSTMSNVNVPSDGGDGKSSGVRVLNWVDRLKISHEAAQGLEYLHKGCMPPLIHRDVKTANILLSEKLHARIADFGLSKAFQSNSQTHMTTAVMGTSGYLDPDEKSDVYSFGVVLLELITGKPPVQPGPDRTHLSHWVQQRLARGDIEDVVDAKLQGDYDVNSAWKVADVALRCVAPTSHLRPTMSEVVSHLKESLELVTALNRTETFVTSRESLCSETSSFTRENSLDAESLVGMTSSGTASARQVNLRTFV